MLLATSCAGPVGAEADPIGAPSEAPAPAKASVAGGEAIVVSATGTFRVGDAVTVNRAGQPWALVSVVEVQQADRGRPLVPGNVFLSARVRIQALADQVPYSQFLFQPFVAGAPLDRTAAAVQGQRPLTSGTLQQGHTAEGWLVYEVPAAGQLVLGYGGNAFIGEAPFFEVVLRDG